jgi:hypothetical protein
VPATDPGGRVDELPVIACLFWGNWSYYLLGSVTTCWLQDKQVSNQGENTCLVLLNAAFQYALLFLYMHDYRRIYAAFQYALLFLYMPDYRRIYL